jgi:hypothetical protein
VLDWAILLSVCVLMTIVGTVAMKRPVLTAIVISTLAGLASGLFHSGSSALWIVESAVLIVCALPVTLITGMLTEKFMDE